MTGVRRWLLRLVPRDWATAVFVVASLAGGIVVVAVLNGVRIGGQPSAPDGRAASARAVAPVELPDPGAYVRSEVQPDGTIQVTHWIRSSRPVATLVVAVPDTPFPPGEGRAERVRVESTAGTPLVTVASIGSEPRTLDLGRARRVVRLTYALTGVTDVSSSVTGRSLAWITFLDVAHPGAAGETRVEISGGRVLNLACATDPVASVPRPCGAPDGAGWSTTLRGEHAAVVAQLDLGQVLWAH